MKKIITTLVIVAAAAVGAQGQTTIEFPANTLPVSFTNLTFASNSVTPAGYGFNRARLLFGTTGVDYENGNLRFTNISLSGDGITSTLTGFAIAETGVNLTDINDTTQYTASGTVNLNSSPTTWQAANNLVSFSTIARFAPNIPAGAQIYYRIQYLDSTGDNFNTSFGNVGLTAVPEPSTYVAAVGLLGLCLWSARRHLFKLAGARSSASGQGENGAA